MPIIKSAKKKMRQDRRKTKLNQNYTITYKRLIEEVKKNKGKKDVQNLVSKAYSAIDKAVKKGVIHKNKGSRLKASVAKLVSK